MGNLKMEINCLIDNFKFFYFLFILTIKDYLNFINAKIDFYS